MGGPGSGRWVHAVTKPTVEGCHSLDVSKWVRDGVIAPGRVWTGSTTWTDPVISEVRSSISVEATCRDDAGVVRLTYTRTQHDGEKESLDYSVRLVTTRPHLGGLRWWFVCPLLMNGVPCARRVAKIYRRGRYFGCRNCHGLAYRSSQAAHQDERNQRRLERMVAKYGSLERVLDNPGMLKSSELISIIRCMD
jgi:hypothetical protein